MIGSLDGLVELFDGHNILIQVNGVGYRVHVPQAILGKYHVGEKIKVYTYTHVREDILDLYGFENIEELKLFEALISVSGIGPKTAIGVFTVGSREQILFAIQKADVSFFTGVPRLGKKNAQKLIIELKGKLGSLEELDLTGIGKDNSEIVEALRGFGFGQKEIMDAIKAVGDEKDMSKKLKMALKYLGK
jgi:Holliday junction DNA helicase RuvA